MKVPTRPTSAAPSLRLAMAVGTLFAVASLALGLGLQDRKGPTVFRKLALGQALPALSVVDLDGNESTLIPSSGKASVVAFLRLDQVDSMQLLAGLEALALETDGPRSEIVVVGIHGGEGWRKHAKALPRRMQLLLDGGTIGDQLGIIVLPSMAVLDGEGALRRAHVLFDEGLVDTVRSELQFLDNGTGGELTAEESKLQSFVTMRRNAAALEAVGQLQDALAMRRSLLEFGLEVPQVRAELGRTLFKAGEVRSAAEYFRLSLELEDTTVTRVWLGRALARTGEEDEALRLLTEALPLTPRKALVHRELAEIYKRRADLDAALEHLKIAIEASLIRNGEDRSE